MAVVTAVCQTIMIAALLFGSFCFLASAETAVAVVSSAAAAAMMTVAATAAFG